MNEIEYRRALELLRAGNARAAMEIALALAQRGDGHGDAVLGAVYEFGGEGVERDPKKALHCYRASVEKSASVEGGLGIARIQYQGTAGERDIDEAFRIYKVAADMGGHYVAQYMLGKMYLRGEAVEKDLVESEKYARLALNNKNIYSFTLLSAIYEAKGHFWRALTWRLRGCVALTLWRRKYLVRQM